MEISCFHCKKINELESALGPAKVGFRDTCRHCGSDLHICLLCTHYDDGSHHECREPQAEWVRNKERANICEYFVPRAAGSAASSDRPDAKAEHLAALEDLFKKE